MIAALIGCGLLVLVALDLLMSVLSLRGGPVTRRFTGLGWKVALAAGLRGRLLWTTGLVLTMGMIASWFVGLWISGALLLSAKPDLVVHATTRTPATVVERVHVAGGLMGSVGQGTFTFGHPVHSLLGKGIALVGTLVVSLSISFLLPVVQAALSKRAVGSQLHLLGDDPVDIARRHCDDEGAARLDQRLADLLGKVVQIEQQHLAYPTLNYLNSWREEEAFVLNLVRLDEAMTLLSVARAIDEDERPSVRGQFRAATVRFMESLGELDALEARDAPWPTDAVQALELPPSTLHDRLTERADHRCRLGRLLRYAGRDWSEVYAGTVGTPPASVGGDVTPRGDREARRRQSPETPRDRAPGDRGRGGLGAAP